ncbi:LysR family transcriptional regulator [Nocardia sp. NEAU-G5]|uniref:LysR family transcriptional regulator n=1 Tax=Nocardia albiluteola TaxID=2842303 RepID=A0ABS6AZD8_9NOCA|nr:LysR family transcriptional regulator [Nocardia albiluteola]MBU3062365.1 LysR family transcriptional regulator [Nocardia albiluteola]
MQIGWNESAIDPGALRVFVVLAEELHFGRTAARLSMSQPRVSQVVRSLERQIDGSLFTRTSRRVQLTPLGRELLLGAAPALREIDRVVAATRNSARSLRIGFLGPFASTLDRAIAIFRGQQPEFPVRLVQLPWGGAFDALRRGEIDMQVYLWPVAEGDLTTGPIVGEYPRMLAIARDHPLAARPVLTLEDLGDLAVMPPPANIPQHTVQANWPPDRTPSGRAIRAAGSVHTEAETLGAVARGDAVHVTSSAMAAHFTHPGVAYVSFTGMPPVQAVLVWHKRNSCTKVLEFAALAERACRSASAVA